jgi:hypothetical protein
MTRVKKRVKEGAGGQFVLEAERLSEASMTGNALRKRRRLNSCRRTANGNLLERTAAACRGDSAVRCDRWAASESGSLVRLHRFRTLVVLVGPKFYESRAGQGHMSEHQMLSCEPRRQQTNGEAII